MRAAAIILNKDKTKILLIHRKNNGEEYWVFPGGSIEEGETGQQAVIREVKEETSLDCNKVKFAFEVETFEGGLKHPFYLCDVVGTKVILGGPEAKRNSAKDWYKPEWISLKKLDNINLVPDTAVEKLKKIIIGI